MPEFQAREPEHCAWKEAVLRGDIQLEEIDVQAFNTTRARPTLPPSQRNVSG
jgi:hypothetical protein